MRITTAQRVQVAKDRAVDDLKDMVDQVHGFMNLSPKEQEQAQKIGKLLFLPDDSPETLLFAEEIGYINWEEEMFYGAGIDPTQL